MFQRSGPFTSLPPLVSVFGAIKCFEREQEEVPYSCFFVVGVRPAWALLVVN